MGLIIRKLKDKGEDAGSEAETSKDKKVAVQCSTTDPFTSVSAYQKYMAKAQPSEKSNTIKIGKTDLHITYRDTTFFLLGLLCGVVL